MSGVSSVKGFALLGLALGLAACGDGTPSPPATLSVEITPADATWYGTPRTLSGGAISTPGLLVPTNDDDSDSAGGADNGDNSVNGDDDLKQLTRFVIRKPSRTPATNDRIHVRKKSGSGNVRVFRHGATPAASNAILDTSSTSSTTAAEGTATRNILENDDARFLVEGTATGDVVLCAQWSGSSNAETCAKFDVFSGYAANFGPRVFGNSNRDGTLDWSGDGAGRRAWSETSGALVFVNRDEDCTPGGARDSDNTTLCAADLSDVTPFKIDASRVVTLADWKPTLWIEASQAGDVHVFGTITDGAGSLTSTTETVSGFTYKRFDISALTVGGGEKTLGIEALEYDKPVKLYHCVTHLPTNVSVACDAVEMRTGRVLLQSNNELLSKLLVGVFPQTINMVTDINAAIPAGTLLAYDGTVIADQWAQDQMEITGHATPHASAQVILDLPRLKALRFVARQLSDADRCYENLAGSASPVLGSRPVIPSRVTVTPHAKNFGGNLEVTGPGPGPGRTILGTNMDPVLRAEIERLSPNQRPTIALDVDWLSVEHVDEVMVVYPSGGSWKVAVADVDMGIALLSAAPARHALFWYCTPTLPATARTRRDASCYGHDDVATAVARSGATPAKLTSKTFAFGAPPPAAKKWNYLRIYAGPGRGQVAHISKVDGKNIEVDQVWKLPTPDWVRCAETSRPAACDHTAAGIAAPVGATAPFWSTNIFRKNDWFDVPTSASKFVVVEQTLDFDAAGNGSARRAPPAPPGGLVNVPALITAGELSDGTSNKTFLDKQTLGLTPKLTAVAAAFSSPVRVPALYFVRDMGSGVYDHGDAYIPGVVNLQAFRASSGPVLLSAKPYGPTIGGADPFETKTNTQLGATPTYVDDWDLYHIQSGEVHCGTNQIKAAVRPWWTP